MEVRPGGPLTIALPVAGGGDTLVDLFAGLLERHEWEFVSMGIVILISVEGGSVYNDASSENAKTETEIIVQPEQASNE